MGTFIILWLGQMASAVGSSMTYFALTLWVWQQTQSATAIALILFFYQLPQIAIALFSGLLVDRVSRKRLLLLSDSGAACCTLSVGLLAAAHILQIWHIYLIAAIIGCFGNIQSLTYSVIIPAIVPKQHHTRAISMGAMLHYGAGILAPALAGILYPHFGLLGITLIDLATFLIAILTLLALSIPKTQSQDSGEETGSAKPDQQLWQNVTFGFRYIASHPSLLAMVFALSAFSFVNNIGETLYQPLILARTGGNGQILGMVVAASGIGGVIGAIGLSLWSGFRRRVFGLLLGFIGTGFSHLLLGIGQFPAIWAIARFGVSLHNPLIFSSYMAIWYAKIAPDLQGRVLAADYLIGLVIESLASLAAGLLADRIFTPAMQSGTWVFRLLSPVVGVGGGSGIALLYVIAAIFIVLIGVGGFTIGQLRAAEALMPDYKAVEAQPRSR
ncbi:MFS transporter [Leptolyngbya sp. 'hensonii']|uniref:MFS transporter n=1 Tax=Leptolyngbya sp. 'hensonii' TaxID=1922337 RepID=UPI00094F71ED|nr:MFS transporter [Leptolyngbya sp. 'hensonii']OLP16994.1 MFS transporter [Leptolyngbya sp. 'hensonii']